MSRKDAVKKRFTAEVDRISSSYRQSVVKGFNEELESRVEGFSIPALCESYAERAELNMRMLDLLP